MDIPVTFLLAPGSGRNGGTKFYIAVLHKDAPIALYGRNTPGNQGTLKQYPTVPDLDKKVREKTRSQYNTVSPDRISDKARRHLVDEIVRRIPALAGLSYVISQDTVSFDSQGSGKSIQRPRSTGRAMEHFWI